MLRHEWTPRHRYTPDCSCQAADYHDADCEIWQPNDVMHIGGGWGVVAILLWVIGLAVVLASLPPL